MEITKEKIIQTADELFSRNGVRVVSIDDICRKIGISKKTFYQFYPQKEELVGDIISTHLEEKRSQFEKNLKGKNAVRILFSVFDFISKQSAKTLESERRMSMEIEKYYPETFRRHTQDRSQAVRDFFINEFRGGIEDGYIRDDLDIEGTLLLTGILHRGMIDYVNSGICVSSNSKKPMFKSLAKSFEDMVVRSVLSEKGMKEYCELKAEKNR